MWLCDLFDAVFQFCHIAYLFVSRKQTQLVALLFKQSLIDLSIYNPFCLVIHAEVVDEVKYSLHVILILLYFKKWSELLITL